MTRAGTRPGGKSRAAILVGLAVSFVVAIDAIRLFRADLLVDPEPSWAVVRLFLTVLVVSASAAAGALASAAFLLWSRTRLSGETPPPLAMTRGAIAGLTAGALVLAAVFRFVALDRLPPVLYIDEVCLVLPALALEGSWHDLRNSIRFLPVVAGVRSADPVIGVIYLEGYRLLLKLWGVTVFGIRFHVACFGTLSVVTAALLARSLLPRGGGMLAAVILAGLRWSLILSRFGWNALALAPIADLSALILLRARRRASLPAAFAGGLVAGIGTQVYLGSWIVALALVGFLFWPQPQPVALLRRASLVLVFFGGFLLVASPVLFLRKDHSESYFARASDQNLLKDVHRKKSWMPGVAVVADSLQAPWFVPDPLPRQDLPKSRLGWLVGVPLAVGFLRALRNPREDLSALLFSHAGAAGAACLYWGQPGHPNGLRFAYLTTLTAVGAAAGALWLAGLAPPLLRRSAGWVVVGGLAISSILGARDALLVWADSPQTFRAFDGANTLLAREARRWERYGPVEVDPSFARSLTYRIVHDYGLDPDSKPGPPDGRQAGVGRNPGRCFRIVPVGTSRGDEERPVEMIRDGMGKDGAAVLGRAACARP